MLEVPVLMACGQLVQSVSRRDVRGRVPQRDVGIPDVGRIHCEPDHAVPDRRIEHAALFQRARSLFEDLIVHDPRPLQRFGVDNEIRRTGEVPVMRGGDPRRRDAVRVAWGTGGEGDDHREGGEGGETHMARPRSEGSPNLHRAAVGVKRPSADRSRPRAA